MNGLDRWEGRPVREWRRLWGVPALEIHQELGSTNDRARDLAREGAEPFTVVIADAQSAGRGRAGSRWDSRPGAGLWFSVVLAGPVGPEAAPVGSVLPLLAGLAVARSIQSVAQGSSPKVKWPNDVLIGGRKVTGILCERSVPGAEIVAGIGTNLLHESDGFPPELADSATSLLAATGQRVTRGRFAGVLIEELRRVAGRPRVRLSPAEVRELSALDPLLGFRVRASTGLEGRAAGVSPDGALLVETEGGVRELRAGSVRRIVGPGADGPEGGLRNRPSAEARS